MAALPPISSLTMEQMLDSEGALDSEKLIHGLNQYMGANYQALNRGLTFQQNFPATIREARITVPASPPWREVGATGQPAFENSWVNETSGDNQSAAFCMFPRGEVRLKGTVASGTVAGTIWTLPVGYRPPKHVTLGTVANSAFGYLAVLSTGAVRAQAGNNTFFGVESSFIATAPVAPDAFSGTSGGQSWPVLVPHGLSVVRGVVPLSCASPDQKRTESVGSFTLDWYDAGNGQIAIRSAWGLQWGRTYLLRLLLLSE